MRYAIVSNNVVVNIVDWDGATPWTPPNGATAHAYPTGALSKGWLWNGGTPIDTDPAQPAPLPPVDYSNSDNLNRTLKAFGLVVADWTGHTPAQLKVAFKAKYDSLNGGGGGK